MNENLKNKFEQINIDIKHYENTFSSIVQKISLMPENHEEINCLFKQLNDETTTMTHNIIAIISEYLKEQES